MRDDAQGRRQVDGLALDERREDVALEILQDEEEHNHADRALRAHRQRQQRRRNHRKERAEVGDEIEETRDDAEHQCERHADSHRPIDVAVAMTSHRDALPDEPPLERVADPADHFAETTCGSRADEADRAGSARASDSNARNKPVKK